MSHEVRCKCGWSSRVSEFYLGDRVACPECCEKIEVRECADVPYGYAPYATWRKNVPAVQPSRLPRRRKLDWRPKKDPHADAAMWLGIGSVFFTLVGCGILPGILMAIFAIRAASDSKRFCRKHRIERPLRAPAGAVLGAGSLLLAAVLAINLAAPAIHGPRCNNEKENRDLVETRADEPAIDEYDRLRHEQVHEREWRDQGRQMSEMPEYAIPSRAEPSAEHPRNRFERDMNEYSNRMREHRRHGAPRPKPPNPDKYLPGE